MAALVWVMMGLALWHFTVFLPDHFWAGIVGAFVGAVLGSLIFGFVIHGFTVPGQNDTDLLTRPRGDPRRAARHGPDLLDRPAPGARAPRVLVKVLAAITTPFGADGAPDLDAFEAHVRWLGEAGLDGLFVAGTTGEGVLLEDGEVEDLVARAAAAAGSLRVIAQVGRPSTGATVALARRALAAGAHGVAAYVPWFYPITQEQVRAHFLAVLEAAGDAPAFLYNIPPRTVNDLSPELAGELARAGFAGMKDSTGDFERHKEYLAAVDGTFEVYTGTEPLIVESVAAGASGTINGLSNCRPELFTALRDALAAGDDVTGLHEEISALKAQVKAEGTVPGGQAAGPGAARRARGRLPRRRAAPVRVTRVVTAGEAMALLDPEREGELELGDRLRLRFAGAESNFAVALARLEVPVAWISRLGADRLGVLIRQALGEEGVDVRWVRTEPGAPTGLFYKWRAEGRTSVAYHRRGSAASRMQPSDVPDEALDGASLVHLTGITMALGEGPRAMVLDVARRARQAGAIVTFDPNYRPALWESPAAAAAAMEPVLEHVDWYLCGAEEAVGAGHGRPAAGGRADGARRGSGGDRGRLAAPRDGGRRGRRRRRLRGRLRLRAAARPAAARRRGGGARGRGVGAARDRRLGDPAAPERRLPGRLGLLLALGLGRFLVGDRRRAGADRASASCRRVFISALAARRSCFSVRTYLPRSIA